MEIEAFNDRFSKMVENVINNEVLNQIGDEMVSSIQNRTRLGDGVSAMGSVKSKLAPLSPNYIRMRESHLQSIMWGLARTRLSHLTLTGQMLSSIDYEISRNGVILKFNNEKALEKAQWAHAGYDNRPQRPFFFLSNLDQKRVKLLLEEAFDKYLLENFN
ncbi:MAG TPA: hypothetical protein DCS19_10560 [Flavobacterium sp.]|nr:hypothetical protein [Flavobacterium sp.]